MIRISVVAFTLLFVAPSVTHAAPVVELFTSQGCYSCPPADDHLAEIIQNSPEVVALEYHVDYWDDLHYGAAGVWKDPFSDAAYSQRQRRYNQIELKGRKGVYTPQMIVNGHTAQVGSKRRQVKKALKSVPVANDLNAKLNAGVLSLQIENAGTESAAIWLAIFERKRTTQVANGENQGKTMINHNIVRRLLPLGQWTGENLDATYDIADYLTTDEDNQGCAVFVQNESLGQIYAADYCT